MFFFQIIPLLVLSNVTEFKIVNRKKDDRSYVVQNDNITLSCTTTVGEPSPTVEIRKGNTPLTSSKANSTMNTTLLYHFKPVSKDDSGLYTCQVTTDDDYTSSKNLALEVKCK